MFSRYVPLTILGLVGLVHHASAVVVETPDARTLGVGLGVATSLLGGVGASLGINLGSKDKVDDDCACISGSFKAKVGAKVNAIGQSVSADAFIAFHLRSSIFSDELTFANATLQPIYAFV